MMPIILSIIIMMTIFNDPNSPEDGVFEFAAGFSVAAVIQKHGSFKKFAIDPEVLDSCFDAIIELSEAKLPR